MKNILVLILLITSVYQGNTQTLEDAIKLTKNEQFDKAEKVFDKLIQENPQNGEIYFYAGENYYQNKQTAKALEFYNKGIDVNTTNPFCYIGLGKILWDRTQYDSANTVLYKAKTLPNNKKTTVQLKIAELYIRSEHHDFQEAEKLLSMVETSNPNNEELYLLRGDIALKKNDGSKAILYYQKAVSINPNSIVGILRQGQLYSLGKSFSPAVNMYKEALAIDSNFAPAHRELAEIYFRAKKFTLAVNSYKHYLQLNDDCGARGRYAGFLNRSEMYEESIIAATKALECDSLKPFTYRYKAYSEFEAGKHEEGLVSINKMFELAQTNISFKIINKDHVYRGKLLAQNGYDSLALLDFKIALESDTNDLVLNREVAKSFMKMKRYPEAIDLLVRNINASPNNLKDNFALGKAYYKAKEFENADSIFKNIARLKPTLHLSYLWRARTLSQIDKNNENWLAKPMYEKVLELIEDNSSARMRKPKIEAYTYLGVYHINNKQICKAKPYFMKIKALDTNNKNALKFLESEESKKCP